jgi:hypothetical protein
MTIVMVAVMPVGIAERGRASLLSRASARRGLVTR